MRVWICQCICPQRHCILAAAGEAGQMPAAQAIIELPLRKQIGAAIDLGALNPWCGTCGAGVETWTYELGVTRFRSMDEAIPALREAEARQMVRRLAPKTTVH